MDSNFLNDLSARIEDANRQLAGRNFQLLLDPSDTDHAYIVDLSINASGNAICGATANRLLSGIPYWFFENHYVADYAASQYSVDPGYYLAISFSLS